jgi:hypothetical protein
MDHDVYSMMAFMCPGQTQLSTGMYDSSIEGIKKNFVGRYVYTSGTT